MDRLNIRMGRFTDCWTALKVGDSMIRALHILRPHIGDEWIVYVSNQ
jgi:hypothetical protein